jgi:hypothetical protein
MNILIDTYLYAFPKTRNLWPPTSGRSMHGLIGSRHPDLVGSKNAYPIDYRYHEKH